MSLKNFNFSLSEMELLDRIPVTAVLKSLPRQTGLEAQENRSLMQELTQGVVRTLGRKQ